MTWNWNQNSVIFLCRLYENVVQPIVDLTVHVHIIIMIVSKGAAILAVPGFVWGKSLRIILQAASDRKWLMHLIKMLCNSYVVDYKLPLIIGDFALQALINSLFPGDVIQSYRSGSSLVQVMACYLMVPSHYLCQSFFDHQWSPVAWR